MCVSLRARGSSTSPHFPLLPRFALSRAGGAPLNVSSCAAAQLPGQEEIDNGCPLLHTGWALAEPPVFKCGLRVRRRYEGRVSSRASRGTVSLKVLCIATSQSHKLCLSLPDHQISLQPPSTYNHHPFIPRSLLKYVILLNPGARVIVLIILDRRLRPHPRMQAPSCLFK